MSPGPENRVRARREAAGMTQGGLAERAGLSRQSVNAIEAGRATPGVDVALRLASVLKCAVEELFGAPETRAPLSVEPEPGSSTGRAALARIDGRWVSFPLNQDAVRTTADGLLVSAGKGRAQVSPLRSPSDAEENVVLMGCATGLGLLADRLNRSAGAGRFLWLSRSSTAALDALAQRRTHVAGVHLVDARTGEANVPDVRRLAHVEPIVLVTLGRWEAGLLTRTDDARRLRGVSDLRRRGVRLVGREPGAGAQRLLEQTLRREGVPTARARRPDLRAAGHLDVARAIAMGAADAGVATRDAALAFDLRFVPLAEERYDLAIPRSALGDARIARLLDGLSSLDFRRELAALGYDVAPSGQRVAEIPGP
jgi:molybdate-binding protein/DNA-binding XRE family transcriptional regulator